MGSVEPSAASHPIGALRRVVSRVVRLVSRVVPSGPGRGVRTPGAGRGRRSGSPGPEPVVVSVLSGTGAGLVAHVRLGTRVVGRVNLGRIVLPSRPVVPGGLVVRVRLVVPRSRRLRPRWCASCWSPASSRKSAAEAIRSLLGLVSSSSRAPQAEAPAAAAPAAPAPGTGAAADGASPPASLGRPRPRGPRDARPGSSGAPPRPQRRARRTVVRAGAASVDPDTAAAGSSRGGLRLDRGEGRLLDVGVEVVGPPHRGLVVALGGLGRGAALGGLGLEPRGLAALRSASALATSARSAAWSAKAVWPVMVTASVSASLRSSAASTRWASRCAEPRRSSTTTRTTATRMRSSRRISRAGVMEVPVVVAVRRGRSRGTTYPAATRFERRRCGPSRGCRKAVRAPARSR